MVDESDRAWVGSMPEAYERWLAPAVFRPFAVDLAGRVFQLAPSRVLELAAGTGVLTRELLASGPSVEVTARSSRHRVKAVAALGPIPHPRWVG